MSHNVPRMAGLRSAAGWLWDPRVIVFAIHSGLVLWTANSVASQYRGNDSVILLIFVYPK